MYNERPLVTRRQCLAGAVVSFGGAAGCLGRLASDGADSPDDSESSDDATTPDESSYSGPLQVNGIEHVAGERTVEVTVTVENAGEAARQADLVVALSHTEAEGSIDRKRPVLLASGLEREVVLSFRPKFFGEDGVDRPEDGEFRFDATFENVEVSEDYPGLVTPSDRSAIDGGNAWPGVAYDPGASAHNPGTEAPRSEPTSAWTVSEVEYAFSSSGPVVANGTVVAGRNVRALSVEDGSEQWVHEGPARTTPLAVGEDVVAFGTPEDFRAVEVESGDVRWTISSDGDIWHGPPTVADGRVYTSHGDLHAIDAASGEVDWTADSGGSLAGPPAVADGVVVSGGEPLRAIDAETGTVRWTVSAGEPIGAAAIAHDTVFALTESRLVALDLAEGRTRWFAPGPFHEERLVVGNESVYAQRAGDYRMVSVDAANGNLEWMSGETDGVLGPPSGSNGAIVVNSEQGTLYGFDTETGETLWSTSVPSGVPGSLAVADGVAYFNESNGPLRALTAGE
ncbi:PQQ-binding-like beta-propeller repeat protein [Halomontanus rarus]|uniref:outer membrane protein assembly factor BamB family protein n=1 Tax=Halomontanus rarus TaxID=3034020 RepID=UPI0023E81128|nr:PQQ-binding-like beta-propeller repeat protein [Halovivax sp. TS33]